MLDSLQALSMQKISSNVVECCIIRAPEDVVAEFVQKFCTPDLFPYVVKNQYAFFVVEKMVEHC